MRSRLPQTGPEAAGDAPQVLLKSPLELTRAQEETLLTHLNTRREAMKTELGRLNYLHAQWASHLTALMSQAQMTVQPFFAQRHLAHMIMEGRMEWRKALSPQDSLWQHSNFHLPLCGRIIPQQVARACDFFFGTAPWFNAVPVGIEDQKKAEDITRWTRHEADNAQLDGVLRDALALAFTQGEQVVATDYRKQVSFYETIIEVACDPAGTEFLAKDGDYVFRTDTWETIAAPIDPTAAPEVNAAAPPQAIVLKRDGQTPQPPWWNQVQWQWRKLRRQSVRNDGARCYNVHFMDILIPTTATNIQDADIVVHYENNPVIAFIHALLTEEWQRQDTPIEERAKTIATLLARLPGQIDSAALSEVAADRPNPALQEGTRMTGSTTTEPALATCKHWLHYDVNGDGLLENIMVLTDSTGKILIYYDYVDNLTPDGERPYNVVRVNPVPNRWHGIGQVQKFFQLQQLADLLFNRINFSQMTSARVDFWRPERTKEGKQNPNLQLNWGRTYTIDGDWKPDDILHSVYLENIKAADLYKLLELVMQIATNMSGIANVNDSQMAGLDTAQLATGVKNLQASGQELFGKFLSDLTPAIQQALRRFFKVNLANINGPRLYKFTEGDTTAFAEITPESLRDIDLDITIDLSRYTGQQQLQEIQGQIAAVTAYLTQTAADPYTAAQTMRPFVVELLKVLGCRDADRKIPKPTPPPALLPGGAIDPATGAPLDKPQAPQPTAQAA